MSTLQVFLVVNDLTHDRKQDEGQSGSAALKRHGCLYKAAIAIIGAPDCFEQPNNARISGIKAVAHCFEDYRSTSRVVQHEYPCELVLSQAVNVADFTLWQLSKLLSQSTMATRADLGLPESSLPNILF